MLSRNLHSFAGHFDTLAEADVPVTISAGQLRKFAAVARALADDAQVLEGHLVPPSLRGVLPEGVVDLQKVRRTRYGGLWQAVRSVSPEGPGGAA